MEETGGASAGLTCFAITSTDYAIAAGTNFSVLQLRIAKRFLLSCVAAIA